MYLSRLPHRLLTELVQVDSVFLLLDTHPRGEPLEGVVWEREMALAIEKCVTDLTASYIYRKRPDLVVVSLTRDMTNKT